MGIPTLLISHFAYNRRQESKHEDVQMSEKPLKMLRPDAKGRITLGPLAAGVSGFAVSFDAKQRIVLEPFVEVAAHESWALKGRVAKKAVKSPPLKKST